MVFVIVTNRFPALVGCECKLGLFLEQISSYGNLSVRIQGLK